MKFLNFINSRKFSGALVGLCVILSAAAFILLPPKFPMHYDASGIADDYSSKIWIFLFPFIQLIIMFLTGRERIKYCLTHSKTFINDLQYNWIVSGICFFLILAEITVIYRAL